MTSNNRKKTQRLEAAEKALIDNGVSLTELIGFIALKAAKRMIMDEDGNKVVDMKTREHEGVMDMTDCYIGHIADNASIEAKILEGVTE